MRGWIAVAIGGALGSMARHGVNVAVARIVGQPSPLATLCVNVIGCAVIGALAGLLAADRLEMAGAARLFVFVGLLGGFTTFSSFGLDSFTLLNQGRFAAACGNVAAQVLLGLAAVGLGYSLAR